MAARNGSGTYVRSYDFTADRDAGSPTNIISADRVDDELDGIATALTGSLAKDGQTTPTADLPMGGFKHTSVATAAPSSRAVYAPVSAIQDNSVTFIAAGGTADAITATYAPAITSLVNGMELCFRALTNNATSTPTFSPNGVTAKTIVKLNNLAVAFSDISGQHHECRVRYNSTTDRWHLLNPTISGNGTTVFNNGGSYAVALPRRNSTGTTDTLLATDRGKHVTQVNSSPIAVTLPQAGSVGFASTWFTYVENTGAGLVTITPTTSTINGNATLKLQTGEAYLITSDDVNYRALPVGVSTVAETAMDIANDTLDMGDTSTATRKSVTGQKLFDAAFSLAAKTTPVTADTFTLNDTAASNVAKQVTYGNLLATIAKSDFGIKFWAFVTVSAGTPTLADSYNMTSITDTATGDLLLTIATDFVGATWTPFVTTQMAAAFSGNTDCRNASVKNATVAAGTVSVICYDQAASPGSKDPASWSVFGIGDQ